MKLARRIGTTLALPALLAASTLGAPARGAAQTRMMIVGGLAVSSIAGSDGEQADFGNRKGIHLGVATELPLLGWISVAPGATYLDRGYTFLDESASIKLSYLEVSAPLRLTVPLGAVSVLAFASPGFALEFGCIYKEQRENVESSLDCQGSDLDFKSWDVTAIVGGGVAVPLAGGTNLLFNVARDQSLTSIDNGSPKADFKHRSWLFNAGASFLLGRR